MLPARPTALALACSLAVLLPSVACASGADTFTLDPTHTRVVFAVSHAGFSAAIGTISGSTGSLVFDRDDWRSARLDVTVPIARLDLGDPKWNTAVLATSLLDGSRFPEARFVSDLVEPTGTDQARICGQLTLRGISRPLCMDVVLNALKRHPMPPFRRTAGFSATATLSRSEYGIDAWKSVIGDEVELRIEAEAVRGTPATSSPAATDAPDDRPTATPDTQAPVTPEPPDSPPPRCADCPQLPSTAVTADPCPPPTP